MAVFVIVAVDGLPMHKAVAAAIASAALHTISTIAPRQPSGKSAPRAEGETAPADPNELFR